MIPGYYWLEVEANKQPDSVTTEVHTPAFSPKAVRAHTMLLLINHTDVQNSFAADCNISRYIQNGQEFTGTGNACPSKT